MLTERNLTLATLKRLAEQGRVLQGCFQATEMNRLSEATQGISGEVTYSFSVLPGSHSGEFVVKGMTQARVLLECQRCLENYTKYLDVAIQVYLVSDDKALQALPLEVEGVVLESGVISVPQLIEDELLLSLPLVSKHEDDVPCFFKGDKQQLFNEAVSAKKEHKNPFSHLETLKLVSK